MVAEVSPEAPGGPGLSIFADIGASLGRLTGVLERRERMEQGLWSSIHTVPVLGSIAIAAGAGTTYGQNTLGPNDGYWWDLLAISAWGFSAGTVDVYLNSPNGEQIGGFTQAGVLTLKGTRPLAPRDTLVYVASGITLASGFGAVQLGGSAVEVDARYWPVYLT